MAIIALETNGAALDHSYLKGEDLEARFITLFDKDPELAEAKVWEAADRLGWSSEDVHAFLGTVMY